QAERRLRLWTFETSKFTPADTLPAIRLHLLILPILPNRQLTECCSPDAHHHGSTGVFLQTCIITL
ncbi:hypothetical protein LEMLEM_LOCUS19210, partial [Lemmus lemmus]